MIVFFLACLDPNGTVVGNPGTGSIYQARTTVAESEGFTYMEASISLRSIDYYDENGLVDTTEVDTRIDLLAPNSNLSLLGGTFTQLTFSFSQTDPMLLSATSDEIGSIDLEIPIQQLTFTRDEIKISGPTIVQLGKKNWLKLENVENASVLQGLLENTSNVYSDDNENGELEEEEQDTPITELEEDVEYTLEGTWETDLWYYGNNQGFETVSLNLSPDGFLFRAARRINLESNEVIGENIVTCNAIDDPEEISTEGEFPTISFASGAMDAQVFYQFLDQDTLIINHISAAGNIQNVVSRSNTHTPVSFDVSLPQDSNVDAIEFRNVLVGSMLEPAQTSETLYAKACLPDLFAAELSADIANQIEISASQNDLSPLWVRIPTEQIRTIKSTENSEVHIKHDGVWENLEIHNHSERTSSYNGNADQIFVGSFGDGPTYLFGEATNFWLATTGQGPIHAFNFPSHLLEVQIQDGGRAEVHYRMDSSISSASGVVGTVEGSGTLDVVSDPTLGTSPMEASGENIVLVCLEENPPEQCESFN